MHLYDNIGAVVVELFAAAGTVSLVHGKVTYVPPRTGLSTELTSKRQVHVQLPLSIDGQATCQSTCKPKSWFVSYRMSILVPPFRQS